jgi:hypothetical protein
VLAVRLQVISETHDNATTAPSASTATIIPDNVRIIWVAKPAFIERPLAKPHHSKSVLLAGGGLLTPPASFLEQENDDVGNHDRALESSAALLRVVERVARDALGPLQNRPRTGVPG